MTVRVLAIVTVLVLAAAPAAASGRQATVAQVEQDVYCPECHAPLAASSGAFADRMRAFIRERVAAGDTKGQIEAKLVDQFGEAVLAAPPKRGFNLLAWLLPLGAIAVAASGLGILARRWSRAHRQAVLTDASANGRGQLDPLLERRVDEELARFDG